MIIRRPDQAAPAVQVRGGVGTMVTQVGDQIAVRAVGRGRRFRGAWHCSLSGDEVSLEPGYVNGLEPLIGKKFLSGLDKDGAAYPDGPPVLRLRDELYDEAGRTWVGIRVRVDADRRMKEKDYTEADLGIIQSSRALVLVGLEGFYGVARLRRGKDEAGRGTLRQISYFDIQHSTGLDGENRVRHFFEMA